MTIDVLKALPNDTKRNSMLPNLSRPRTSSVRRSLFGDVNHEESMAFLQKELDTISSSQRKRWNFDFVNEKPINDRDSNYEWTPVQPDDQIPKAYALCRLPFLSSNAELLPLKTTTTTTTITAAATTNNNNNYNSVNNRECTYDDTVMNVCHPRNSTISSVSVAALNNDSDGNSSDSHVVQRLQSIEVTANNDNEVTVRNGKTSHTQKSLDDYFFKSKKRSSELPSKCQKDDCSCPNSGEAESGERTDSYHHISKKIRLSFQ